MAIVRSFDFRSPPMGRPAYTEASSKWWGIVSSASSLARRPNSKRPHFEVFSVYAGSLKCKISSKWPIFPKYPSYATVSTLAFVSEEMIESSHSFRPNRTTEKPSGVEVCLVTNQVQQQFDKAVEAGAIPVVKPAQKPWGQLVSYVRDNNGCLVEICSPVESAS